MHEFMTNRLHMLAAILSLLGIAAAVLIVTDTIKGVINAINHHGGNHERQHIRLA